MPDTAVELDFAGGRYRFWLPLPRVIELQRKGGEKSIFAMYDEMSAGLGMAGDVPVYVGGGSAMVGDIRETIRLGLIGGNAGPDGEVGPTLAGQLVEDYTFPNRPLLEGLHTAWAILHAAIHGIQLKKADGAGEKPRPRKRSTKAS